MVSAHSMRIFSFWESRFKDSLTKLRDYSKSFCKGIYQFKKHFLNSFSWMENDLIQYLFSPIPILSLTRQMFFVFYISSCQQKDIALYFLVI